MNPLIAIGCITASIINTAYAGPSQDESQLILNRLLRIDNPNFITHNQDGTHGYNSLKEHQAWERLYIKYAKYGNPKKALNKNETRTLLYIGMIARLNHDAAMSGSFSSDLIPIYKQNKPLILSTLNDLDYLIPSTCYFLNRYFGYEDKHADTKNAFINNNKKLIIDTLGQKKGNQCMNYFITDEK